MFRPVSAALAALLAVSPASAQGRPPSQRTGPITITGDGSSGPGDGFTYRAPGGVPRSIASRASDTINLRDMGNGVCAGDATVDTNAMFAALSLAKLLPGKTIDLPSCTYSFNVAPGQTGFKVPSDTRIRGNGDTSVIKWNDDAESSILFSSDATSSARAKNIVFESFLVRGTADTRPSLGAYPILPYYVDGLVFRNVTSEYSRTMGLVARFSSDVTAIDNKIKYSDRDGINFANCTNITISNNNIQHTDDDAIAAHSGTVEPWGVRRNITITGNRLFDVGGGIDVLAARHATISGNTIDAARYHGITVETVAGSDNAAANEGVSAAMAITVTNNIVTNVIDRSYIDQLNAGATAIRVTGSSARKGTAAAIPGEPNTSTGAIADPYRETFANSLATNVPTPGSYGIIVANNVVARTFPATNGTDPRYTKWSDLGFGKMWTRNGWVDPSLPEAAMQGYGLIAADGVLRDVLVTNNIFRGLDTGALIQTATRYDNFVIRGNEFVDMKSYGILDTMLSTQRVQITDNIFDLDPYHKHAARGANGTWASQTGPVGIFGGVGGGGYFVRANTFRNMGSVTNSILTGGAVAGGWYWSENLIEADATVFDGFSSANKGVGNVPATTARARYVRVGSDPSNGTFGAVLAMPVYP